MLVTGGSEEVQRAHAELVLSFDHETSWSRPRRGKGCLWGLKFLAKRLVNVIDCRYDLYFERGRGWSQRNGAENIVRIFREHGVVGTWFCTGYALLRGNVQGRCFGGNLKEPYATVDGQWYPSCLWRATQGYFDEDPHSTFHENPEWYFGDQIWRFHHYGQDIQCHTFNHIYLALESPRRLRTDLAAWQAAARNLDIPAAVGLACPQESYLYLREAESGRVLPNPGRDIGPRHHAIGLSEDLQAVLFDSGIRLIARVPDWYWKRVFTEHRMAALGQRKPLLVLPGRSWNPTVGYGDAITYIDQVAKVRGVGDLWTHPGTVLSRNAVRNFDRVVRYARERADNGDLRLTTVRSLWESWSCGKKGNSFND